MKKISKVKFAAHAALLSAMVMVLSACMATYPKEKLPEAIKEVCKLEYNMDVDVSVIGSTVGIYYPMEGLLDVGLGVKQEAWDKISNLILVASRVVLSTDADIKFYCVITQDARLPELQMVIIKYVEDVKHGMYRNISRNESFKRTLFSINLTPQARKERSVEKVFEKLKVEDSTREKVMDEFFRSPPTELSDIGYWRGTFYLKDITLPEFLAAQMANRAKIDFRAEKDLAELYKYDSSEGFFVSSQEGNFFLLKFKIFDQKPSTQDMNVKEKKVEELIAIASEVVSGYKFKGFDYLELEDQLQNAILKVSADDVYSFDRKKMSVKEIAGAPEKYF